MTKKLLCVVASLFVLQVNAQVPSYVPTDGLVGWWPFNGNANDESGNGNNGTVIGATLTEDRNGNSNSAYYFSSEGCDTRIDANVNTSSIQTGLTISVWVMNVGNGCFGPRLLEFWPGSNGPGIAQWGTNYNLAVYSVGSQTSTGFNCFDLVPMSPNNEWTHLAYTNDGSFGRFYKNGQLLSVVQSNGNPILASSVAFGRMNHPAYDAYNGNLDDIGIWNRALSDLEVLNLYNGCNANFIEITGLYSALNFSAASYFCNDNPGSTFTWEVSNGIISSGQGTNSIVVLWGNEGMGTVSVVETNAEGCDGPVASFFVDVQCNSNITSINGNNSPIILSQNTYTVNGPADSQYVWSVSNGVIVSGQGTNTVNVIWAAQGEGTLSVIETTNTGCESPVLTITTNAVITSVMEEEQKLINLYPNPTSDRITLQCEASFIGDEYVVYDSIGTEVQRGRLFGLLNEIDISSISAGTYLLSLKNGSSVVVVKKQ